MTGSPAPIRRDAKRRTTDGVIYFGSTTPAMHEALEALEGQGRHLDALRVRGFPFPQEVMAFIAGHDFETKAHSYAVQVTPSDGVNSTVQSLAVSL